MWKKCSIFLLPTDDGVSPIYLDYRGELQMGFDSIRRTEPGKAWLRQDVSQHLYVTTEGDVEVGDWCILDLDENSRLTKVKSLDSGHPVFTVSIDGGIAKPESLKRILATTDFSIAIVKPHPKYKNVDSVIQFPKLSLEFIQEFIKNYNRGNLVTHVIVEFTSNSYPNCGDFFVGKPINIKMDINNQVNAPISLKYYTRGDVINILKKFNEYNTGLPWGEEDEKWIKFNL